MGMPFFGNRDKQVPIHIYSHLILFYGANNPIIHFIKPDSDDTETEVLPSIKSMRISILSLFNQLSREIYTVQKFPELITITWPLNPIKMHLKRQITVRTQSRRSENTYSVKKLGNTSND